MCPFTVFDFYLMLAYNCVLIGTVGMMFLRCGYFWAGFLVLLALVLLIWLKFCAWELKWKIDEWKTYKDALRSQNPERVKRARERYEERPWAEVMFEPLKMAGAAALIGLVVLPLWIIGIVMDAMSMRSI